MNPDFRIALEEADRALSLERVSPAADARVRAALRGASPRHFRTRLAWVALAASLAGAGLGAGLVYRALAPRSPRELGGLLVEHAAPGVPLAVGEGRVLSIGEGGVMLKDVELGARVQLTRPATLRKEARGLRLVLGSMEVAVERRAPGEGPVRVLVSDGELEVHGTHFSVEQGPGGGEARLHEGALVFRSLDGREVALEPGGSVRWPLPRSDGLEPVPLPPAGGSDGGWSLADWTEYDRQMRAASWAEFDRQTKVELVLREVEALKAGWQPDRAVHRLERALSEKSLPPASAERLSFELGSLLTYELEEKDRACAHWLEHARRFQSGRNQQEILQAAFFLGCKLPPRDRR
ncbi:MAG: FecR family protein [Myxococcaceae bacterium]